jgi:hypothetical protein
MHQEKELTMLYEECLESKMRIEVCYRAIKENYLTFRKDAYKNLQISLVNVKQELKEVHEKTTVSNERIDAMFGSYKELLVRFMLYKQKMAFLINNSRSIISDTQLKKMVADQDTMMKFVTDINAKISDDKITELYDYVADKTSNK